ncbi:MAG TPA: NAD(P)H-quinone oxidoreductase [Burkholderiales bacterium]|nr:NAD(P)H-quinone oxidoreductase [Burkholderiales bacterium]
MLAIEIREPGGPDVLVPVERAIPRPQAGEVLIRVAAAGVNRADVMQRLGVYPMAPGMPTDIPGLEVSGTVAAVGTGVTRWRVGDPVCALLVGRGYAEYAAAPELQCMPIPGGVGLVEAAGLPETFCTVWPNLFDRAALKAGEVLLVHGGTSGIGVTAIQLGRAFGALVLATAGSDEKCEACLALGATRAINYRREDFHAAGMAFTDGRGVDVILDVVGAPYAARDLDLLARGGRLILVGMMGGAMAEIDLAKVLLRHLTVTGSSLRSRPAAEKAAICAALERHAWPLFGNGTIRPVVHRTFALRDAVHAHRLMEASAHIGKILLIP